MKSGFTSALYEVNMQSGALTLCRQFTGMEEITGLYILPHVDKGAPAKVSDLKASFSNDSTTGKVSFTMPSATKGGETLSGNINYKVYLGDQKKEGTAAAGKTVQLDATLPEGRCKIVVTTSNAKGESERTATSLWIGKDAPATVSGLSLKRTLDKGLQLRRDAVSTGAHNGYVDPASVTYKVVRQPDTKTMSESTTATVLYDNGESDFSNALSVNSTSAITETTASESKVYVVGRTIILSGIGSLTAGVWTVDGKCVWRSAGEKNAAVGVPTRCHIVKVGGRTAKVLVK